MSDSMSVPCEHVVDIRKLDRSFGPKRALQDITLQIPRGKVLGLIGGNGAGKTTLIKHILGAHYAESGSVRVFGFDPVTHPVEVLGRIGYMSEDRDIPYWMRVQEIMNYTRSFFPKWDASFAEELREMFDLDPKQRIRTLSRGQTARVCLLVALAHRPELLVLDEPSSGLDPVVRRDILAAIVQTVADEGRTVLFSSHLLDEVERLADRVAILHEGRVLLEGELDTIQESFRRITLRFEHAFPEAPSILGAIEYRGSGHEWTYVCRGDREQLIQAAKTVKAEVVHETPISLDEIFVCSVNRS
ncbi:MAG: ABC transporter ATP-binding protein [Planctomycetes bacterium]|nr:ABC transporter ATP-binding protein [Planctomycetota bacterium]